MPHLDKLAAALIVIAVVVGFVAPRDRHGGAEPRANAPAAGGAAVHAGASRTAAAVPRKQPQKKKAPPFNMAKAAAAARAAGANELGMVPILMIHRVMAKPQVSLDRSTKDLYDEFTGMAKQGYVPITAAEFVKGQIDIPAGRHPVVLTFDDGSITHADFDGAGNPKPDTAIGVIQRVAKENPGFRPVATFFVNRDPFYGGSKPGVETMRWLVRNGFEIANHTTNHKDMRTMSHEEVAKEIGTDEQMIESATGKPATTFAFPFGSLSEAHLDWAQHGTKPVPWNFTGMFLAGWKPADSPYAGSFDPRQIPRIRDKEKIKEDDCKQYCSTAWLEWLAKNPDKRYTSDGNPATIAFPQDKMIYLYTRYKEWACPY
ncbi:polysaccharide deacetylase family protein [Actinoallomurus iriomotensis]|uniref:Xylanase n=1 Tax=Actinoallomurus iriomotensis TaxID=478107 RepID=A0A9W6RD00_9ACTN|nr:polysaccharide deacetylase family protein [Actinoallomurus iriomotensis]GLY71822.1 xylanase [Actinoallomurus iriomotensis]